MAAKKFLKVYQEIRLADLEGMIQIHLTCNTLTMKGLHNGAAHEWFKVVRRHQSAISTLEHFQTSASGYRHYCLIVEELDEDADQKVEATWKEDWPDGLSTVSA